MQRVFCFLLALGASIAAPIGCGEAESTVDVPSPAGQAVVPTPAPPVNALPLDQTLPGYDTLLKSRVDANGWVDYHALAADRGALDAYVASLAVADLSGESTATRLAHLLNAYNAFTLVLILDGGIPDSIMDLHGGKPWDVMAWNLGGKLVSLNQIEHELIRPVFQEPRIHWALVCAAYSCPPLRAEAYAADTLDAQLAGQEAYVLNFNHPRYVTREDAVVKVSPLFEWYADDFVSGDQGPEVYAAKRLGVEPGAVAGVLSYDWRLNDISNRH